ncbi:carbohydrate ABC transporter substrate-binding protein [Cryptosporangium phraense]|uniref:Carbohydrate ABC transporter substrate-binding protein n=1 Tax=Cryptosporangium phraense TaxID=2593070 RepID=A0A545B0M3_9ACTN|nr:carbohydrate ABC transporter substrate-binding protein [Cryptosporangium phraense]
MFAPVAAAGCGTKTGAGKTDGTSLWCWPGGLSTKVVADAKQKFRNDTTLIYSEYSGNFRQKLTSALSGRAPAITGIKGEDIASFLPRADQFVDLTTLGADRLTSAYLPSKWQEATAVDGRQVGIPIDIGPTAMFYRTDVFDRAGLPTDPADVDAATATWAEFLAFGKRLRARLPGTYVLANTLTMFTIEVCQSGKRFVDQFNHFVGDDEHVKNAWDVAVQASTGGLCAGIDNDDKRWGPALAAGSIAVSFGAAWHAQDIESDAPSASGAWRVAAGPAGGANIGGSFLAIPASTTDQATAFEIIEWILSPENEARAYTDARLFPSTPSSYSMPALTEPEPYYGGQRTIDVFSASARKTRRAYEAPSDAAIQDVYLNELRNVEYHGKKPEQAWSDAVKAARTVAAENGVN